MTAVRPAVRDEQDFAEALDRWSPSLIGLAAAFTDDARAAHRMVERGWLRALQHGALEDPAAGVRVAVVRAMAEPARREADPALLAGQRALRRALRTSALPVLPRQQDRRSSRSTPAALPSALAREDLRRLAPSLRLVLLLSDVQRWPAAEVEELLEVRPEAHRAILGHARRCLLAGVLLRRSSA